jgi:hypothetical protein
MHEYKARGSAQGLAAGALAGACRRTLTLTGTAFGGYSSTLFYLLWRFCPPVRAEFGYGDEARWVARYGIVERITKKDADAYTEDGRHSKRRSFVTRTVEKPGVSPAILFHLIGTTVFLRLSDVAGDLPPYDEHVVMLPLDDEANADGASQASSYRRLANDLQRAVAAALAAGSKRLLAAYLQSLLAYPDACTATETVVDPVTGEVVGQAPALPDDRLYPKERALLDIVERERRRGRRVLVYITHTESRDLSPRLRAVLERAGHRVAVLKAGTVAPDRREEWVAARVREGTDVLVCHPRLVQTGLDLIDWPTIVWYQTEYSVYVMRQASRRSWRIGQRQPVEVHYLVYRATLQAEALALVAAKMRSALLVDGELPADGIAALEGDGQDLLLALARRIADGDAGDGGSLEALFAQVRLDADESDEVLGASVAGQDPPVCQVAALEVDAPESTAPCGESPAVLSFAELAALVRRPSSRPKRVHPDQLSLWAS